MTRLQGVPTLCYISQSRQQRNIVQCYASLPLTPVKCLFDKQLIFQRMKHWKKEKGGNLHLHQVLFLWKICSSHCFGRICSSIVCRIYVAALFGRMLNAARRLYEEAQLTNICIRASSCLHLRLNRRLSQNQKVPARKMPGHSEGRFEINMSTYSL